MTYNDLRDRIGDMFAYGYDTTIWAGDAEKTARVERMLVDGLNNFYKPPILPPATEQHSWSFLRPTVTIDLLTGVSEYDLPTDFAYFNGALTYAPGVNILYPKLRIIGEEDVRFELQTTAATGRPMVGAVRAKNSTGVHTTRWELIVAPIPDEDYQVKGSMTILPVVPGATGDVPLGGQPHEQTLIESCLAQVEIYEEYQDRRHTERFKECLAASISHDNRVTCPATVGYMGDNSCELWERRGLHGHSENITTYNGVEY